MKIDLSPQILLEKLGGLVIEAIGTGDLSELNVV